MKKILCAVSITIAAFALSAFIAPISTSDNSFEGVITYSVSSDDPQAATLLQTSSMKIYIKGDKAKMASNLGMQKRTVFMDMRNPDKPVVLLELLGYKYQVKDDTTKPREPIIKYTDETKTIAGYTCHKAVITVTDKQGETYNTDVYCTEQLPSFFSKNSQFKGLKGFPLKFSQKQQGVFVSFSATTVDKQTLSDDVFVIPPGYKLMTAAQIQQDIQTKMSDNKYYDK